MTCSFCKLPSKRIVYENNDFLIIRDGFPVTEHHSLIITKQHNLVLSDMSEAQLLCMHEAIRHIKESILEINPSVTGFNIGINEGEDAGQTVMHFHCHVIPRRKGDMQDPRGGVRGVIPGKQKY
jgi:diadenosine tetraphosphate (Ap4A) HIT family hydrolase